MEKSKKNLEYNIGLDIGEGSVGWAVTDLENNLLKKGKKYMWGSRLFDGAVTAVARRGYRSTRRRMARRKQRIALLQQLIGEEVLKQDPSFFFKMKSSYLSADEKSESFLSQEDRIYNLFRDTDFNDVNYYTNYPTIYHLREELKNTDKKMDIRLIYLALHHILKFRGNFLYEGQEFKNDTSSIENTMIELVNFVKEATNSETLDEESIAKAIEDILIDSTKRIAEKKELIVKILLEDKENKNLITNIVNLIVGYKADVSKIFDDIDKETKITFKDELKDEQIEVIGNNIEAVEMMQSIYSWFILQEILQGESEISKAFIRKYEAYKEDLRILKEVYKKMGKAKYDEMFRKESLKNYYAYNIAKGKCNIEDLYKTINKDLEKVEEDENVNYIKDKITNAEFLVKLNTTDNSAIPYQLHRDEMLKIIDNQGKYYEILKQNKEKIKSILEFRIPYYVGPLVDETKSKFAWMVRKSEGDIFPWNFESMVDKEASAEKFITRMTNKCSYLLEEDVIPKCSLLYSEFCLLNELNGISINNRKISKDVKDLIIEKLFKEKAKVTKKGLIKFLINNQIFKSEDKLDIVGFQKEDEFASSLASYRDFKSILGHVDETNIKMIEEIIRWITLFEDKKLLKSKIQKNYPEITEEQLKKILKKQYKGWSALSRKLIDEIRSTDFKNETIIEKLRNNTINFMQIINNKDFGFDKIIEEAMPKIETDKIEYADIEKLQGSPAIKRSIWQTVKIVEEITKVLGKEPKNIYLEFARSDEQSKRTVSRKKRLENLYKKIQAEGNEIDIKVYNSLKGEDEKRLSVEMIYLYYIQNGRSLYSGATLDLDNLTTTCEVDHILPRTYIKDDSISNKALVLKSENQTKTDKLLIAPEIIDKMEQWWTYLYSIGLIDNKKYFNLKRREITRADEEKFINRQLVETRQITKHVANLLVSRYRNSNIMSVKANLTSSFRKKYDIYKIRELNDFHHADDAYLAIVIGNYFVNRFEKFEAEFIYDKYVKNYKKDKKAKFEFMINIFDKDFESDNFVWKKDIEIEKIKRQIQKSTKYNKYFVTKKLEELTSEFYNQNLKPNEKNAGALKLSPIREGMDVKKYGGYDGENKAYFAIIEYINSKNKKELELVGVPILVSKMIQSKKISLAEYFERRGYTNCKILVEKILKYQVYEQDDMKYMFKSSSEISTFKPLTFDYATVSQIYKLINYKKLELEYYNFDEEALNIYSKLVKKLEQDYKTSENLIAKFSNEKTVKVFTELNNEEKIKVIKEIMRILKGSLGNLQILKMSAQAGRMQGKSFKTKQLKEMTFISTSITGMYERRFNIDELENDSNK